jgi:hypothetical protein
MKSATMRANLQALGAMLSFSRLAGKVEGF